MQLLSQWPDEPSLAWLQVVLNLFSHTYNVHRSFLGDFHIHMTEVYQATVIDSYLAKWADAFWSSACLDSLDPTPKTERTLAKYFKDTNKCMSLPLFQIQHWFINYQSFLAFLKLPCYSFYDWQPIFQSIEFFFWASLTRSLYKLLPQAENSSNGRQQLKKFEFRGKFEFW